MRRYFLIKSLAVPCRCPSRATCAHLFRLIINISHFQSQPKLFAEADVMDQRMKAAFGHGLGGLYGSWASLQGSHTAAALGGRAPPPASCWHSRRSAPCCALWQDTAPTRGNAWPVLLGGHRIRPAVRLLFLALQYIPISVTVSYSILPCIGHCRLHRHEVGARHQVTLLSLALVSIGLLLVVILSMTVALGCRHRVWVCLV
jgi:hypothetical protein